MTEAPIAVPTESQKPLGYRHRWLILGVMLAAEIMDLLDATIINVGGPTLQKTLAPAQLICNGLLVVTPWL